MGKAEIEARIRAWAQARRPKWFPAFAGGTGFSALQVESLEAVRFVAFLQGEFGATIRPEDFFGPAFSSLEALVAFLAASR